MTSYKRLQNIYVDTSFLQAYLIPKNDAETWWRDQVGKVVRRANDNKEIFIIFPLVVAGELLNNLKEENMPIYEKQQIIGDFFKLLENEKIDIRPANSEALKLAAEIKGRDHRLGDTDLLIVAQALCDCYSVNLLMHDKNIITSQEISSQNVNMLEENIRPKQLTISDSIN